MSREPAQGDRRQIDMRLVLATAMLALVTAACGASRSAADRPSTPGGHPTAAPPTIKVTVGMQDHQVRLGVGQQLVVYPPNDRTGKPDASLDQAGSKVLRSLGGSAAEGWRFTAVGSGTARVLVTEGPQCAPGELCPMYRTVLSRVLVTVTG